jgi:predicted unusual protein kinase regulating ubiquinone biosynthesis (AarF/ABC1/UbiB family)
MARRFETRGLSVPSSRLARATRLGGMTTSMMARMAAGAARDLASGKRPRASALLLTPANIGHLTAELARMRGAAMKMGQLISMESSDLLPPDLSHILSQLRQDAHFMPPKQLKQVLVAAYGPDFQRRFKRFDPRPIAAASIGQVHRAVALDGRILALKVQYPGIRGAIDADVSNLGTLLRYSGLIPKGIDIAPLLDEARKQLHEEADYRREAEQLRLFGKLIGNDPTLRLPRPHDDLSTDSILAMDFMPSNPIETLDDAPQPVRDRVVTRLFALFLCELFDWQAVQTDPNFANYRLTGDTQALVLLDFGAARPFGSEMVMAFRALLTASATGDEHDVRTALLNIGYIRPETPPDQVETILRMIDLLRPALVDPAGFDFGNPSTLSQLRAEGQHLGLEQGFAEIPPMDALYLQRKAAGLVLLATRLKARVPLSEMLSRYRGAPLEHHSA